MLIYCTDALSQEITGLIQTEFNNMGIPIDARITPDGIVVDEIFPFRVDEGIAFEPWCLQNAKAGACKSPQEVFEKIKGKYPDVEIEGIIEIGDDDNRNQYYFSSPSGSKKVTAELALDGVPFSKCWMPCLIYSDYGQYAAGFVSKESFEEFIEYTADFLEENDVDFDEFIHSDLLESFFEEDEEAAYVYPAPDDLSEFYLSAWEKYQDESKEED